ncbi:hypothetical protein D0Y65_023352 [Glycine soja]|uniref:Uncharacterized protein n=1 Tax=Glycine soja TaxID=3848 RepID=A0A445IXL9_GLYSO|nr:hypothetical protein D0Y65_023352 [Glycine soja]
MSPPATVHQYVSHSKPLQYVSKLLQYVSKAFPIRFPSPDALGFHDNDIIFAFLSRFAFLYRVLGGRTHQSLNEKNTPKLTFLSQNSVSADSMTTIAYLRSSPASIACREGGRADYNCSFYLKTPRRRWKKTLIYKNLLFLSQTIVAMAGNFDRKSTESGDRVANNQEATKLE